MLAMIVVGWISKYIIKLGGLRSKMSEEKIMSFQDENGKKVDYAILEQRLICGNEYVAIAPVNNKADIELYKIKFDKDWNESLSQVESENEINMFKQVSDLKF